ANSWTQVAKLTASDGAADDRFGASVSVSGNTAVIGSYLDDDRGLSSGSAYIFQYNSVANSWTQVAKLTASDGAAGDRFGYSVSVSGDTAVIGSSYDADKGAYSGSAYIFQYSSVANNWTQVAKLTASDGAVGGFFCFSVSVSGDTAVIGNSCSAYIFQYSTVANNWMQVAKLTASDGTAGDSFGVSVSVSGDTAVINRLFDDDRGYESGSAYIFDISTLGSPSS
ncbi:hypothetical protein ACHAXN_000133, partial [Cyclotella atomus]